MAGAASALLAPRGAFGQAGAKRRIGYLAAHQVSDPLNVTRIAALEQGLAEFGWKRGGNLEIDYRIIGNVNPQAAAREIVASRPDVIVCIASNALAALMAETADIPIVFVHVIDPLNLGFVANLNRPGGNVTGFSNYESSIFAKQVDLFLQAVPKIQKLTVMQNPDAWSYGPLRKVAKSDGDRTYFSLALGYSGASGVNEVFVRDIPEIEQAFARLAGKPEAGVFMSTDIFMVNNRASMIELAAKYRIAMHVSYPLYVTEGGLISYGVEPYDLYRRAGAYVDKILKGVKAGELPVQLPIKFQLALNLKTAAALGIEFPTQIIARADEIIE